MRRDALKEATEAEVAAGRRWPRWQRRIKWWVKTASLVVGIFTSAAKAWLLLKARDVGRAELPSGGSERMAADRLDHPGGGR